MKKTSNPFEELLVGLVDAGVTFVTVGGIACAFNGYVRTTEDVLEGRPIPYLSREALIELKTDSLREKDKMDVVQLKALKTP